MSVIICKNNHLLGVVLTGILLSLPMSLSAKCGGVDYSWGADALSNAHDYTDDALCRLPVLCNRRTGSHHRSFADIHQDTDG